MEVKLTGSLNVEGKAEAPPSKSMMQRAVAAGLLAKGRSVIRKPSFCDDAIASIGIAEALGAKIEVSRNEVVIEGGFSPRSDSVDCGESGLSMRMFTPLAALHNSPITFRGKGSLLKRPVFMIREALEQLGAECADNGGYLPLTVRGPVKGGKIETDGSVSSQTLTGLLTALPVAEKDSIITVRNLKSSAYADMTIQLLSLFGIEIQQEGNEIFMLRGSQVYRPANYTVEGDWSGASFLLVAGAVGGYAEVENLDTESFQPDKKILEALERTGARIDFSGSTVAVQKSGLRPFTFDATGCPDLFPPLVSLAAACSGKSVIRGVQRLKYKESSRGEVLREEFGKLGINIVLNGDEMAVEGGRIKGGKVFSHNDHRIAMAAAVAAIVSEGPVIIDGANAVEKSYPGFFNDFGTITGIKDIKSKL